MDVWEETSTFEERREEGKWGVCFLGDKTGRRFTNYSNCE